jgi:tRNA nucleotidyltransferase (CCA-adding enzyme)
METYLVGGAVRDRLLGRVVKERDYVVVGASPQELLNQGFLPVGKSFPVFLHPTTHEEYALARTERKKGPGYTGFDIYSSKDVTLIEDLKRRDLTINAIAETSQGDIIDPYQGFQDIEKRILRHVSPAFVEDPVRILRVGRFMARFASLGFQVAPETLTLMQTMVSNGEVDALVPERIWREFEQALLESNPGEFILTLESCGAWTRICPEWAGVSYERQRQALRALSIATHLTQEPTIRFASLMKCITLDAEQTGPVYQLAMRWHLPKSYRDLWILSIRYVDSVQHTNQHQPETLLDLLEQLDAFRRPERFQHFLTVCEIDWQSQQAQTREYFQNKLFLSALRAAQSVSIASLVQAGVQGENFSEQLRKLRLQAIESEL